ncbi:hypothetical protein S83_055900 [Arachis hypogaea]|nr:uncharacterized protein DS421_16g551670 [Arachis hypogaea]
MTRDTGRHLHTLQLELCSQIAPNSDLYARMLTGSVVDGARKYLWSDGCMCSREWGGFLWLSKLPTKVNSLLKNYAAPKHSSELKGTCTKAQGRTICKNVMTNKLT